VAGSISSESKRNWLSYTSETNYRYNETTTSNTNIVQTNASASTTQIGSSQSTGQTTRNGQTLNSTSNSTSDITTTIVYVSDLIPDNITRTIIESQTSFTFSIHLPSGLASRYTVNSTGTTITNNGAPVVSTHNFDIDYTIELMNEAGGIRTYKHYVTGSIIYQIYRIRDGIILDGNTYTADNILSSTTTYTAPNNSTIHSRLPSFRLASTVNHASPSSNSNQTVDIISETATTMMLRVRTFANNVLISQSDQRYERRSL
jgi:hypothetical protein